MKTKRVKVTKTFNGKTSQITIDDRLFTALYDWNRVFDSFIYVTFRLDYLSDDLKARFKSKVEECEAVFREYGVTQDDKDAHYELII